MKILHNHPSTVSIIIPVYQGGAEFRQCLAGVTQLSPLADEIIVVVDGEDDGSGAAAEVAGAKLIRQTGRFGPAAARNAGAKVAKGQILFFLDADTVPSPTVVAQVRDAFQNDNSLAALIGSYDDEPGDQSFLSQYRNLLHHYVHQTADSNAQTFWGACGAVRREVFFAVDGFDQAIDIPAMEDVELGYRMVRAGHQIRLDKHIQIKHLKHWGVLNMIRTDVFQRAIPWSQLLLREERLDNNLNLSTDSRLSAMLIWLLFAALFLSIFSPVWPVIAGLIAMALFYLNLALYDFFRQKRGWIFALSAVPWHWLYYLYGSASFAYVILKEGNLYKKIFQLIRSSRAIYD